MGINRVNPLRIIDPKKSPVGKWLIDATRSGDHEALRRLLSSGLPVDVNHLPSGCKTTPLWNATRDGHDTIVEMLLGHDDIDVNAADGFGETSLHCGCREGQVRIVEMLLQRGDVKVNVQDRVRRFTPLHIAAYNCHAEIVALLVRRQDVDVNLVDKEGDTPFNALCRNPVCTEAEVVGGVRVFLRAVGGRRDDNSGSAMNIGNVCEEYPIHNTLLNAIYLLLITSRWSARTKAATAGGAEAKRHTQKRTREMPATTLMARTKKSSTGAAQGREDLGNRGRRHVWLRVRKSRV